MPVNDDLGKRMKEYYEQISKTKLMRRCPVVLRIDGRAFHTFCRSFDKPFDNILIKTMQDTMKYLCENIGGCVLGYTQSDEISLLLIDYKKLDTAAWFDYEVQKLCSISASMATLAFNKFFYDNVEFSFQEEYAKINEKITNKEINSEEAEPMFDKLEDEYYDKYYSQCNKAMFDSRCFNIPKEEVTNYFYWRQLDATRNSIQMVGQAIFSHKELQNKSCNDIQNMLLTEKDINWNDLITYKKRGSCCVKKEYAKDDITRTKWVVDKNIPIFKGEDRSYIDDLVFVGE